MCGTLWLEAIRKGECTPEDMSRAGQKMRERWENYHLEKAKALGFDIDLKNFRSIGTAISLGYR